MDLKIYEKDGVIIRHYSGELYFSDIIDSWKLLFDTYSSFESYQGILNNFLEADIKIIDHNLNELVEFLAVHMDQLKKLKIAVVMDTPLITNTIIVSQKVRSLQIKPFSTERAALQWIRS